jgi:hypothetical protein
LTKTFAKAKRLSCLPFTNTVGGGIPSSVEKTLASVGLRAANGWYKQGQGVVDPQSKAVHPFGTNDWCYYKVADEPTPSAEPLLWPREV